MRLNELEFDQRRLTELCRRYGVQRLDVLGRFARGDALPASDLDVMVTFEPEARIWLEFVALEVELETLVGRPVDLLTRAAVEQSPNKYFRHHAMRTVELLYESA